MGIIVYNRNREKHVGPNNYPIYRPSILGNPYTDKEVSRTMALYGVKSREEAIEKYKGYFDMMYNGNVEFRALIDEIYNKYKNGITVYLECYCDPLPCHGNVIKEKLEKRLIKEKINETLSKRKFLNHEKQ